MMLRTLANMASLFTEPMAVDIQPGDQPPSSGRSFPPGKAPSWRTG